MVGIQPLDASLLRSVRVKLTGFMTDFKLEFEPFGLQVQVLNRISLLSKIKFGFVRYQTRLEDFVELGQGLFRFTNDSHHARFNQL